MQILRKVFVFFVVLFFLSTLFLIAVLTVVGLKFVSHLLSVVFMPLCHVEILFLIYALYTNWLATGNKEVQKKTSTKSCAGYLPLSLNISFYVLLCNTCKPILLNYSSASGWDTKVFMYFALFFKEIIELCFVSLHCITKIWKTSILQ